MLWMVGAVTAAGIAVGVREAAGQDTGTNRQASVVRVEKTGDGFRLARNGQPYFIQGAGGRIYLETLKAAGGNSLRTWGEDDLEPLLDRAQALGLTVTIGIWLGQERQGFNYSDEPSVRREYEKTRAMVRRYRNHPALLMWGLGNEMEGSGENAKIWSTVNEIAKMVKQEDPNHPTMTVIAEIGGHKIPQYNALCPDVDVLGINSYAGLPSLPRRLKEAGFQRPYVITEFGPPGHWEVRKTAWGAPIEPSSEEKAEMYRANYASCIAGQRGQCLGSYVFQWGHKQEATATWFGMLLPSGEKLPTVDAMTFAWTGKWPGNRAPLLGKIETAAAEKEVAPGAALAAQAVCTDPDGDSLLARWEVRSESTDRRGGGDRETEPLAHPECFVEAKGLQFSFKAPQQEGAYRLFTYVYDGTGNAATANVPFYVKPGK
jgi:hypothetical protein